MEVNMIKPEVTCMSSKGQVVINNRIRKALGISEGSKLMIVTDGNNLLLKPLEIPKMKAFEKLIEESRKFARKGQLLQFCQS